MSVFNNLFKFESKLTSYLRIFDPRSKPLGEKIRAKNDFLKKDLNHENIASNFLKDFFSEEITESIRLHVVAKRYLCSIDNSYYESLSKASKNSFKVQGGALNKEEINELENNKYFKDAVRLRKWDDRGKVSLKEVEELDTYKEMIVAERLAIY